MLRPILVSSGEPAGIGPDICLSLAGHIHPLVVIGDANLLAARAQALELEIQFIPYCLGMQIIPQPRHLFVLHVPAAVPVIAGQLDVSNAAYVLQILTASVTYCQQGIFAALVTAPVQKSVINAAGIAFTGHTEFLATQCNVRQVVMLLACAQMKVALVTTHLPLRAVADAITADLLYAVIAITHASMRKYFAINSPLICVAGLNPHAGECGYLGQEEIEIIAPTIEHCKASGMNVIGPVAADTMFITSPQPDVFIAMYHDQGLSVLKYAGFGHAVNITLGLPIIRTSVDHGTALSLAGTGKADASSMQDAVAMAITMAARQ